MADRYDLPPVARVLRRLCGVQGLCALVQRWRGQSLYVPTPDRLRPDHPIAQAVGMEAARRLSAECGGNRLTVPLCIGALRAERDREIWRRYMDGVPTACACAAARLNERPSMLPSCRSGGARIR